MPDIKLGTDLDTAVNEAFEKHKKWLADHPVIRTNELPSAAVLRICLQDALGSFATVTVRPDKRTLKVSITPTKDGIRAARAARKAARKRGIPL